MTSTNTAFAAAGYTTAPSPSYGCKLILKDGVSVGHFDAVTAWSLPGMQAAGAAIEQATLLAPTAVPASATAEDLAAVATLEAGVIALAARAAAHPV